MLQVIAYSSIGMAGGRGGRSNGQARREVMTGLHVLSEGGVANGLMEFIARSDAVYHARTEAISGLAL